MISLNALGRGLAAGSFILLLLAGWIWLHAPTVLKQHYDQLASVTVDIEPEAASGIKLETLPAETEHHDTTHQDSETLPPAPVPISVEPAHAEEHMPAPSASLPPAPIAGLYADVKDGKIPQINKTNGQTPFDAYRRPFDPTASGGKPVISLVLTDMGLSQAAAKAALAIMPPDISFAMSPYASDIDKLVAASREKGHEAWIILPMQTPDYPRIDPGPKTLLKGVQQKDNLEKLNWLMTRGTGYAGFIGSQGNDFMASEKDSKPVMSEIYSRGLAYVSPEALHESATVVTGQPSGNADLWLGDTVDKAEIEAELKKLEDLARTNGHAVGIIRPLPLTYHVIGDWAESLEQRGFVLAPLSANIGQGNKK
jgi:polysaccharide deacetylase 2 family uncharacterized protein YibQ